MNKLFQVLIVGVCMVIGQSCSKKAHPSPTVINDPVIINNDTKTDSLLSIKKPDSLAKAKPVIKKKPKEAVPKIIVVDDRYASKSVDGRYYYDLQGHRYWRNNKDGKYYLFNKSMLTDDAFKKPD